MIRVQRLAAAAGAVVAIATLAACGSTSGGSSNSTSGGSSTTDVAQLQKRVDQLSSPQGTYTEQPTTSPKPEPNKFIGVVSCGESISACAQWTQGSRAAISALGWKSTLFDTKADPSAAATGIRNAIAQKADGIFVPYTDCKYIKSALQEAKAAKIPVVGAEGYDCSDSDPSAPSLFTYVVSYGTGPYPAQAEAWGESMAAYAIAKQGGKSHALAFFDDTSESQTPILEGIKKVYAQCSGCSVTPVRFPLSAFGTTLQQTAEENLLKHPDTNAVLTGYEAISTEIYPAVRSSGKKVLTFMGEGGEAGMNLVRQNPDSSFVSGWPAAWEGWAAIDALNRIFDGQKPVATGQGLQLVYAGHNLPAKGPYTSPIDFQSMYLKAWGVN